MHIELIKNTFCREEEVKKELCAFLMQAKKLSMGEVCAQAEQNFARFTERAYCVLFNSGSSANLALVQAYLNLGKLKKGDRVGFSSLTWSTNVMPLIQLGLEPVPIDVELETLNVDSARLERAIDTYSLKAFFSTNILGFAGDLENIRTVCKARNVLYFEDNCESLGSRLHGTLLGNFGHAATYSFFVGHHFSTIEGGAVCTDDPELYRMLLITRAHGWDRNLPPASQIQIRADFNIESEFYDKYTFYDLGFNLRPTEITGFLLNKNIEFAHEIIGPRERNFKTVYEHIRQEFKEEIYPLNYSALNPVSNFAFPIVCKDHEFFKRLLAHCTARGIETRPVVAGNIFDQPFFKKYIAQTYAVADFPNVHTIHTNGFYFGNNPDLTAQELAYIQDTFSRASVGL